MICTDHIKQDERLGYMAWMERANVSHRKGEKQRQCSECRRWYFAWELRAKKPEEKQA